MLGDKTIMYEGKVIKRGSVTHPKLTTLYITLSLYNGA